MTITDQAPADVPVPPVEPSIARLAAALAAVQQELPRISKDQTADAGTYKYSYADLAAVSAELLPLLGKNGLAFTAWPRTIDGRLLLRYYLLHESGESMTGDYPLKGNSPQQLGSEITYARRYCLCAVTGVAPDDDDDAAAAEGAKAAERAKQQEDISLELSNARDKVRGAWAVQFGAFDGDAAGELYRTWSKGGALKDATAGQLTNFAGFIHSLPAEDAGSDPADAQLLPTGEQQASKPFDDSDLSNRQRGQIFALFEDLGMKSNRGAQLEYLTTVTGRTIKSRGDLRAGDADAVINALKEDVAEARSTGLAPDRSEPAAGAQSATGETSVPAGSEPPPDGGAQ